MSVKFSNSSGVLESLIPAPLVSIREEYVRDSGDVKLRPEFSITLNGTIVNVGTAQDSPDAQSFGFARTQDIINEQARIRELFSNDGGQLVIEDPLGSGTNNLSCYCRVNAVSFPDEASTWTTRCNYTIDLTTYQLDPTPEDFSEVDSTENSWSVEEQTDGTITLSHSLSARGVLNYSQSGVMNNPVLVARNWCQDRTYSLDGNGNITPDSVESFGLADFITTLPSGNHWNRSISEQPGIGSNSYSITENFIYNPSGTQRETYSVVVDQDSEDPYRKSVSINGTIIGYAAKDSNHTIKYARASGYFENTVRPNIYSRLSTYVPNGFSVLPNARSSQITHDIFEGQLSYNFKYQASSGSLIDNSITESITVTDTGQKDVFATIAVPGRSTGPVVQYMHTKTLPERSVKISALISLTPMVGGGGLPSTSGLPGRYLEKPYTSDIINAFKPNAGNYYLQGDVEDWNPLRGQYSRSVSWTLNPESNTVYGLPSGVATSV